MARQFMVVEDGMVLAIGSIRQIVQHYDVEDVHDTFDEPLMEQDMRAARLRARGLAVEDIADAMSVSRYRAERMLLRVDSGRYEKG